MKRLELKIFTPSIPLPPIGGKWGEREVEHFHRRTKFSNRFY
jgi:hypothetical protein